MMCLIYISPLNTEGVNSLIAREAIWFKGLMIDFSNSTNLNDAQDML